MKSVLGSVLLVAATSTLWPAATPRPVPPPRSFDFTHDVLPVLQRYGCSSAYCHGSATGRAGLKLSLFGSDPAADHAALATQLGGRRVDLREPDQSLVLQKALGRLDHGGGRRLPRDGSAHHLLRDWIAAGAPWSHGERRELQALHVHVRGDRVVAEATFGASQAPRGGPAASETRNQPDRGDVVDVSDTALFSSTDPTVVEVDAEGRFELRGEGQAWLMARFGNLTALTRIVRPFARAEAAAPRQTAHALDRELLAHLGELGLPHLPPVDSRQLARRLHLDLVGRPPTPQELDVFAAKPDVPATIARLVQKREFAEVWAAHLARWFELPEAGDEGPAGAAAARSRDALVQAIGRGDSLPAIARGVVLGAGGVLDRIGDARDRADFAGRALLGMRIGCARCHDHPSDRWRHEEHVAFSACFAPPRPDGAGGTMAGAMFDTESGERVEPRFLELDGALARGSTAADRRGELADFLVGSGHDAFARNACNRVFAMLFGRGLVEPIDDHRLGNPPLAAGLLAALVGEFHRTGGQLPALLAFVMTSGAYAAPAAAADGPDAAYLAARTSRPLLPATFLRAVTAVVGRDVQGALPASPLARELALRNGPLLHSLLAGGGTTIDATFEVCGTPHERLVELWRLLLSRPPRAGEEQRFLPIAGQDLAAFRDLAWAVLTGREFGHHR
ncbi:MAG TPA: DUF1549 domain-containing protein [Planctomycetota bacterium]